MDYREKIEGNYLVIDKDIFQQGVSNTDTIPLPTGNDLGHPQGNITSEERLNRIKGTKLREYLY